MWWIHFNLFWISYLFFSYFLLSVQLFLWDSYKWLIQIHWLKFEDFSLVYLIHMNFIYLFWYFNHDVQYDRLTLCKSCTSSLSDYEALFTLNLLCKNTVLNFIMIRSYHFYFFFLFTFTSLLHALWLLFLISFTYQIFFLCFSTFKILIYTSTCKFVIINFMSTFLLKLHISSLKILSSQILACFLIILKSKTERWSESSHHFY